MRPIVIRRGRSGSNLMTMFDPSSTTQMLSCRSTRTVCANTNPYSPWPISRMNLPEGSNSKSRAAPRANVRRVPSVALGLPVRV